MFLFFLFVSGRLFVAWLVSQYDPGTPYSKSPHTPWSYSVEPSTRTPCTPFYVLRTPYARQTACSPDRLSTAGRWNSGGGSGVDRKSIDGRPRSTVLCTRTGQGLLYAQVMRMPSPAEPWPCPSTLTALSPLAFTLDQGARNSETCPVSRVRLYLHPVRRNEDQTESTSRSDDRCITGGPLHAQGCSVQVPYILRTDDAGEL